MKLSTILNKQLNEFPVDLDYDRPHPQSSVGVEVEVEGVTSNSDDFKYWDVVHDGSLQHGLEFVSKPVWGTAISKALDELGYFFNKNPPYLSMRTSVHVHINTLDMTVDQLVRLIELYLYYEPCLFRLHEEWNRYDNIFCVPTKKSTAIQKGYAHLLNDLAHDRIRGEYVSYKYSALNPNSLKRFGTLEFRHMGGCCDVELISYWINILLQLKVAALEEKPFDKPQEVFGKYLEGLVIKPSDLIAGAEMLEFINLVRN
jgi:hypothetical protein